MRDIDHIIIHCSATAPHMDIGAADIDRWHRKKGWWGNGYHYVIRRDGTIESEALGDRCRPLDQAGAHVGDCGPGWNKRSIGICLVGGVNEYGKSGDNFTVAQLESLKEHLEYLAAGFPDAAVMGHRDLIRMTGAPPKACPSYDVSEWMRAEGLAAV